MASVTAPRQKFEGHTDFVKGIIHLPGGQRIITCSDDSSLRVWNLESGKQIGQDWRDGESAVKSIALSPDGKKLVSGSRDGVVRLWDIDTCKVIARWIGHTAFVLSVCWSQDGRKVVSGSSDGTARQWDVESGETTLELIENGHEYVRAVAYSPDMTMIATGGQDEPWTGKPMESSVQIWDAKTGKLVATLKGHTWDVSCLIWTKDQKTLISGSFDCSVRTWDTIKWEQTAVLLEHTALVFGIATSPNGHILASVSGDRTARLWNLENGQPISSPLQHAHVVNCVSFSTDGRQIATGCWDNNAYIWDIVHGASLDDPLDPKANKSALHSDAMRRPVQQRPPAYRVHQGPFDGVRPDRSQFFAPIGLHHSIPQLTTLLGRLFHRSPSNMHDTSPSSPLGWAQNILSSKHVGRGQSCEGAKLQGHSPVAVVKVPYAKAKHRNAYAREKWRRPLRSKNLTASSSRPPNPNAMQQSSTITQTQPYPQAHAAVSISSITPAIGDNAAVTISTPSRPDRILRQAGLWARFWLFIGCLPLEYQDGRH